MTFTPPIVAIPDAPEGLTELKIRDAHGHRIGFFQAAEQDLDDEIVADLVRWQARHAHEAANLTLMPSAASA